jgi:hypothetical protein
VTVVIKTLTAVLFSISTMVSDLPGTHRGG